MNRVHLIGVSCLALIAMDANAAMAQAAPATSSQPASAPTPAEGQTAATPQITNTQAATSAAPASAGDIVVTGSRLTRGFSTPTPVTAVSSDQLAATAPNNIAEGISNLPAFANSANANRTTGGSPNGTAGQSILNLRSLGTQRNLVLIDGQRVIASNASGGVDINRFPQSLVRSVEVVTGGASAAYGSDAVSGVINFILDTRFTGLKAEVQHGVSTYGDTPSTSVSATWGGSFAGDKLHIVLNGEYFQQTAIDWATRGGRSWEQQPGGLISNPVKGALPTRLIVPDVRIANGAYGGLITNTILKGTEFAADGTPFQHDYGTLNNGTFQSGGTGNYPRQPLNPSQKRKNLFAHMEYDLGPHTTIGVEALYGRSDTKIVQYPNYMYGQYAFTIYSGNPYIPSAIQQRMTAANISSFTLGKDMADTDFETELARQELQRYHAFIKSDIGDSGTWHFEGHYIHSRSVQYERLTNMPNLRNSYAAADAVRNPQTGQIVCRSQYYTAAGVFVPGGTGLDPGCVPVNLFGGGVGLGNGPITQAGQDFIYGTSIKHLVLKEDVADVALRGELPEKIALQGGPISVALGGTYRHDSGDQTSDAVSQQQVNCTGVRGCPASLIGRQGGYLTFDPLPFRGAYSVKEGFLELGIPVFKDVPFARALDINLAGRIADYSTSGVVYSWKAGGTWRPVQDIMFRVTRSRDTRAPDLTELFSPASITSGSIVYKGATVAQTTYAAGNLKLVPEKADTLTAGVVLSPRFLHGFNLSVDWYHIKIGNAIDQLGNQNILNQCTAGVATACALLTEQTSGGVVNGVVFQNPYLNLSNIDTTGIDIEAYYGMSLGKGRLTLRALANYVSHYRSQFPNSPAVSGLSADVGRVPWRANFLGTFSQGGFTATVSERFIGPGKYDATFVQGIDINDNTTPAVFYTDLTLEQKISGPGNFTVFLQATNLFNRKPPLVPIQTTLQQYTYAALYDVIGRYLTAGVRVRF
jgi:outer membrane receptor protein involved in Fe transport